MQQHGSKYFACKPPTPTLGMQSIGQLYQNMVMLHIKLNGIMKCSNMVANILSADPSRPWRSKVQNSIFSEHDLVAYQIKGNHRCNNMIANIFARRLP